LKITKSQKLNHFHFIIVGIPLLQSFNKDPLSFLSLFFLIFLIKRETAQTQIAHNSAIHIKQVEDPKHYHNDGEYESKFVVHVHAAEEGNECRVLNVGDLKIVETQRIANPRQIDRGEYEAAGSRVFFVKRVNPIELNSEHSACHDIGDVGCEEAVHHVGSRAGEINQVQHVHISEHRNEGACLRQEDDHRNQRSEHEQANVKDAIAAVAVL
jgi:hypothetical protein